MSEIARRTFLDGAAKGSFVRDVLDSRQSEYAVQLLSDVPTLSLA
jgi:hypothetical protein